MAQKLADVHDYQELIGMSKDDFAEIQKHREAKNNGRNNRNAEPPMGDEAEKVIGFGGELCSLSVERAIIDGSPKYRLHVNDYSAGELLDEPENDVDYRTEWFPELEQALARERGWSQMHLSYVAEDLEEELLRVAESYPSGSSRINQALQELKNWEDLGLHCTEVDSPDDFVKRGYTKFGLGDYAGAVEEFSHAINKCEGSDLIAAYYGRSQAYKAMGDMEKAASDWAKAWALA